MKKRQRRLSASSFYEVQQNREERKISKNTGYPKEGPFHHRGGWSDDWQESSDGVRIGAADRSRSDESRIFVDRHKAGDDDRSKE